MRSTTREQDIATLQDWIFKREGEIYGNYQMAVLYWPEENLAMAERALADCYAELATMEESEEEWHNLKCKQWREHCAIAYPEMAYGGDGPWNNYGE